MSWSLASGDDGNRTLDIYLAEAFDDCGLGTLATQAINHEMRLEAIAARLGHRTMHMTLTYARIADRVVADQYKRINTTVDALYTDTPQLPADYETLEAKTARTRNLRASPTGSTKARDLRSHYERADRLGDGDR